MDKIIKIKKIVDKLEMDKQKRIKSPKKLKIFSKIILEKIWISLNNTFFLHLYSAWLELMGLSNKVTLYNNLHKNNQRLIKTLEQILQDKFFSNFCAPWLLTSVNLHFIYHLRTKKSQKIFFRKKILSAYLDGFCSRIVTL